MSVFSSAQQKREQLAMLLGTGNRTRCEKGAASTGTGGNAKILGLDVLKAPSPIWGKRQRKVQQVPGTSTVAPGARVGGRALAAEGSVTAPAGAAQRGQRC